MRGLPLKVSPLFSSTSIGEPCAAVNSERGSYSLAWEYNKDCTILLCGDDELGSSLMRWRSNRKSLVGIQIRHEQRSR